MSTYDVAIVGAGSAGIGAAKTLAGSGLSYAVLEASHRIGGRAYTEEIAPGVPFDLGCHWLHSASLNPYVAVADAYGFRYEKGSYARNLYLQDHWATAEEAAQRDAYSERAHAAVEEVASQGRDISIYEAVAPEEPWASLFHYWVSLATSADSDQVSVMDFERYRDTGEDWPIEEGYGTLIERFGAGVPVSLNHAVEAIDWGGAGVRLLTAKGELEARCAILTVSTGVLGAGAIRFEPALPVWKREAIAAVPLGNHNRIGLVLAAGALAPDHPQGVSYVRGEEQMWFRLRPFGFDYVVGVTGGRFAWWLERAGVRAQADFAEECLKNVLGADIGKHIVARKVTAWGGDPWVRGAYSAAKPGEFSQRAELARPVGERLYFAGEATSPDFFATAHGAYLTGVTTAREVAARLGVNIAPAHELPLVP